jgi:hypothetical protein
MRGGCFFVRSKPATNEDRARYQREFHRRARDLSRDRRESVGDWTTKSTAAATREIGSISGPCLQISRVKQEHYALVNRHCAGKTVLAVIETRGAAGRVRCKTYTIGQSLAMRTNADAPPRINHECVLNQGRCTKAHLGDMFPECDS